MTEIQSWAIRESAFMPVLLRGVMASVLRVNNLTLDRIGENASLRGEVTNSLIFAMD
jgi:hypothetical protein